MSTRRRADTAAAYALLTPSLIGVGLFLLVPVVIVIGISFTRWDLVSPPQWVGLDNYVYIFGWPTFRNSLWVSVLFTALTIPTTIALGLILAVAINRRLPGTNALRVLYVLPWVCAPLALGVVWRWIFDPTNGALNALLGRRVEWLTDLNLALPSVAFVQVWSSVGYVSLFFLAGLQQIPNQVYEAARLDGASAPRTLWSITVPLLRPTMFFVLVTSIISSFQVFDSIYAMTRGGPGVPGRTDVIAARIYDEAFVALRLGRAAAMAVVLFAVLVTITLLQQRYFRRRITYDMS
ncbi:binding-protein-dependent transport systems inner membrane component [Beutenbergia cavernae DSM 12333]|uniref:Binding-protein-dependent transport systems inner membrane component n=1 Tax=Beutenbergia cavernae (strain ATCC BAA-8 / DSM 12333 / CCUG 43141 / JCM 11478 / NBRC 16432 / NCIMB 13614 / HKI 0122) TaxID=471853 RepID=C5BVH1_BEUC1|nr:sugar ABC transporter permease [Beutenbergia cavernae]ACQ78411.1 binding-protein-dependent transport systems inner membrane component [Beutenbergia cavernae DSM 12333]